MAAIFRRTRGSGPQGMTVKNTYVEDAGRRYRIAYYPGNKPRVLLVALKMPSGRERFVDPQKRRGRALIAKAELV